MERARELSQRILIVDTHIDLPYRLTRKDADVGQRTEDGDFDYPRAREGGLDLAFLSIYVPASYQEAGGSRALADALIDRVERIVRQQPDRFTACSTIAGARSLPGTGRVGLALGCDTELLHKPPLQGAKPAVFSGLWGPTYRSPSLAPDLAVSTAACAGVDCGTATWYGYHAQDDRKPA